MFNEFDSLELVVNSVLHKGCIRRFQATLILLNINPRISPPRRGGCVAALRREPNRQEGV